MAFGPIRYGLAGSGHTNEVHASQRDITEKAVFLESKLREKLNKLCRFHR
jgi:hypothetical protein